MPIGRDVEEDGLDGGRCAAIDVWTFHPGLQFAGLAHHDDLRRAERLLVERDRVAFLGRRGAVRHLLREHYSTLGAVDVRRARCAACGEQHGRPELVGRAGERIAYLSTSATNGLAVCAVSTSAQVGIDLERLTRARGLGASASVILSDREMAATSALPEHELDVAVLRCWTLKEAYLKALGVGLRRDPRTVETSGFLLHEMDGRCARRIGQLDRQWHATCRTLTSSSVVSLVWRGTAAIAWQQLRPPGSPGETPDDAATSPHLAA